MTTKQRIHLCVDLWGRVCAKKGWDAKKDAERRRDLYADAFRDPQYLRDISPRVPPERFADFQERDFDEAKRHFLSIVSDSDIRPQMRQLGMGRTRLIVSIMSEQASILEALLKVSDPDYFQGAGERYIAALMRDKFHGETDPTKLSDRQLPFLRNTLARCINNKRNEVGWTGHEMTMAAREFCPALKCPCAVCRKMGKATKEEVAA